MDIARLGESDQEGGAAPVTARARDTRERIIAAAYGCFERNGIGSTSIEDISAAANVTRPTFYKYFNNKMDLTQQISIREALKLNAEVRSHCTRHANPIDMMVEAVVQTARLSIGNAFVRRSLESIYFPAISADPQSPVHQATREWWRSLIERARAQMLLANDLDLDQMVSWLSFSQVLLIMRIEAQSPNDLDLRAFVRRFIVEPLLKGREVHYLDL